MPTSRTMPTISSHGCGFAGSCWHNARAGRPGLRLHVSPRERFIDENGARSRGAIAIVEVASRHEGNVERLEVTRSYGGDPEIRDRDWRVALRDLDFGPSHRHAHAGQAVAERDGRHARFPGDPPFESA